MKNCESLPHTSGIYKITNLIDNAVYIGQAKNIYDRYFSHHRYEYKHKDFDLYKAIREFGLNNFSIEVIEICPLEKLDDREVFWIAFFDSFHNGYNMTAGGQNWSPKIHSIETEEKRRATQKKK